MAYTGRGKTLHGAAVAAVLLLALGLRLHALGRLSLWVDEGHAVWFAAQPLADFPRLAGRDTCLPLSYLIAKPFVLASTSDAVVRLPAVFFGVASIAVIWALGRRLGGRWLGLLAALLAAVHPLHLHYSQEARMYTMYVTFIGLAALLLLRFLDRPGRLNGALLAGAAIAAAYTHNVSAAWVLALVVTLVPVGLLTRPKGSPPIRGALVGLLGVTAAVVIALLPWVSAIRSQVINVGGPEWWIPRPTAGRLTRDWHQFLLPWAPGREGACGILASAAFWQFYQCARLAWVGLVAAGLTAAVLGRRWRLVAVILSGVAGVALIVAVSLRWSPVSGARTWLPVVIPLTLVQATTLVVPWQAGWGARCRPLRILYLTGAAVALCLVLVLSGFGVWSEYTCQRKEDWRSAVALVVREYRAGDVIYTREGLPHSDAFWYVEQKVLAWYLRQHGVGDALRRAPAVHFGSLDFGAGRCEAPPIRPDEAFRQVERVRDHLAAGRRVWYIRRHWNDSDVPPPVIDWLDRAAVRSRSWRFHVALVTRHWGLKPQPDTPDGFAPQP